MDGRPVSGSAPYPFHNGAVKEDRNGHQPELSGAQEAARAQGVVGRTLLIGGCIILLLYGMLVAFITFLCIANTCTKSGRFMASTAPLGRVLTISQVTSHLVPVTVPFVMGFCAYQLGAQWLRSSRTFDVNRPSPLQCVFQFYLPILRIYRFVTFTGSDYSRRSATVPISLRSSRLPSSC